MEKFIPLIELLHKTIEGLSICEPKGSAHVEAEYIDDKDLFRIFAEQSVDLEMLPDDPVYTIDISIFATVDPNHKFGVYLGGYTTSSRFPEHIQTAAEAYCRGLIKVYGEE